MQKLSPLMEVHVNCMGCTGGGVDVSPVAGTAVHSPSLPVYSFRHGRCGILAVVSRVPSIRKQRATKERMTTARAERGDVKQS